MALLEVSDLSVRFATDDGPVQAVDRVSFSLEQRQVLALAYFGGHTQREIAVLTSVPLGTVKSRMFTAVQRLRSMLADQLGPDTLVAEARMAREVNR